MWSDTGGLDMKFFPATTATSLSPLNVYFFLPTRLSHAQVRIDQLTAATATPSSSAWYTAGSGSLLNTVAPGIVYGTSGPVVKVILCLDGSMQAVGMCLPPLVPDLTPVPISTALIGVLAMAGFIVVVQTAQTLVWLSDKLAAWRKRRADAAEALVKARELRTHGGHRASMASRYLAKLENQPSQQQDAIALQRAAKLGQVSLEMTGNPMFKGE